MAKATSVDRKETKVTQGYLASIPASVRRSLDIQPGDRLVWTVKGRAIELRVRKVRRGAFADFEPFDFGEETHAAEEHDVVF